MSLSTNVNTQLMFGCIFQSIVVHSSPKEYIYILYCSKWCENYGIKNVMKTSV